MKSVFNTIRKYNPVLLLILAIGFWLRIQGLLYGTFAFTYDVGRDFLAISQMITSHKPLLIGATTGLHGIFYGPTWYYILTPFFILFQGNPKGIEFVMVLSGVLTIFFGYLLGKRMSGNLMGLIFALFLSVSQILIAISSQIWNPNLIPMFAVILTYMILMDSKNLSKRALNYILVGLLIGAIIDLEIVFGALFLFAILAYLILNERRVLNLKNAALLVAGIIFVQLPRIIFEFRHDFLMTKAFLGAFSSDDKSSLFTFVPRIRHSFDLFLRIWSENVAAQISIFGLIIAIAAFGLIILSYKRANELEKKATKLCGLVILIYFVGFCFLNHDIESHYYIGLPIFFALTLSLVINFSIKYLKFPIIVSIAFITLLLYGVSQFSIFQTFYKSNWIGDASVYRNQVEVIDFIYRDANNEKFNSITYTPPIYDYPYQYLFQWKGKRDYGYQPDKNHQELFYLIIEPDLQFPVRQEKWLDLRKNDGEIISSKKFKSGIIVQKRKH